MMGPWARDNGSQAPRIGRRPRPTRGRPPTRSTPAGGRCRRATGTRPRQRLPGLATRTGTGPERRSRASARRGTGRASTIARSTCSRRPFAPTGTTAATATPPGSPCTWPSCTAWSTPTPRRSPVGWPMPTDACNTTSGRASRAGGWRSSGPASPPTRSSANGRLGPASTSDATTTTRRWSTTRWPTSARPWSNRATPPGAWPCWTRPRRPPSAESSPTHGQSARSTAPCSTPANGSATYAGPRTGWPRSNATSSARANSRSGPCAACTTAGCWWPPAAGTRPKMN